MVSLSLGWRDYKIKEAAGRESGVGAGLKNWKKGWTPINLCGCSAAFVWVAIRKWTRPEKRDTRFSLVALLIFVLQYREILNTTQCLSWKNYNTVALF